MKMSKTLRKWNQSTDIKERQVLQGVSVNKTSISIRRTTSRNKSEEAIHRNHKRRDQ